MGLTSFLKRISCNCASDCHLNEEVKELKTFIKKLAIEDLREIKDYFLTREEILEEKRKQLREEMRRSYSMTRI